MVTRPGSEEDVAIHASSFGGLNTTAAPLNATTSDALSLLNIDPSISGNLPKRRGTEILLSTGFNGNHYMHNFRSNYGIEFLVVVYNQRLQLIWVDDGVGYTVVDFENVFKYADPDITFVSSAEDNFRVLMFSKIEAPKQLVLYEYSKIIATAGATTTFPTQPVHVDQSVCDNVEVFVNGVYDPTASITFGATNLTVTPSSNFAVGDKLVLVYAGWNWWAEAEFWDVKNFRYTVPRFGETPADKLLLTPPEILVDGLPIEPYGTILYNKFVNRLTLNQCTRTTYPVTATQYQWSNGVYPVDPLVNIDSDTVGFSSPVFAAFGQESNYVAYDQLELIHFNANRVYLPGHEFRDADPVDLVQTTNTLAQVTSTHYVKVLSSDYIELFNDEALAVASTIVHQNVFQVITAANVAVANDFMIHNGTQTAQWTGTGKILPNAGVALPGSTFDRNYFIAVGSPTTRLIFYLDAGRRYVLDLTAAVDCYVYTTRRIILRKRLYNTVTYVRARKIPFNNATGIQSQHLDFILADFLGLTLQTNISLNTTGYTLLTDPDNLGTAITVDNVLGQYVMLINAGSSKTPIVLANKQNLWSGSAANSDRLEVTSKTSVRGGYFPAFGYGYYANYVNGSFNSCGAVHQSRLVLSGFPDHPGTVVVSGFGDFYRKGENYNYFQINDSLEGADYEPFDVVLQDGAEVNGIISWQQLLFVFSRSTVYRSVNGQAPISPSNRAFVILSNQGCVSTQGLAIAGNNIFYIAEAGLFSVPVVFENEYRSTEVTMKIRDIFETLRFTGVHYHKAREKLFMFSETHTYVYDLLSESWSRYYSYIQFNHVKMSDVYDFTRGWTAVSGVHNSIHMGLISWYSQRYLDYAQFYPFASSPVTIPAVVVEELTASAVQSEYKLTTTFTEIINTVDYEIWYGPTRATSTKLTQGTDWIKISNSHFRLSTAPTNGYKLFVIPIPKGTWYGWGMYIDNIPLYLRDTLFGTLDFVDEFAIYSLALAANCLTYTTASDSIRDAFTINNSLSPEACTFNAVNSSAYLGLCYPTEFMSIAFAREVLGAYKRTEQIYTWFTQRKERYDVSDFNPLSSFETFVNQAYKYPTAVTVALIHNMSAAAAVEYDLLSENAVSSTDEWVLFKNALQRLGYCYRLYVTSTNGFSWNLAAYQILAKIMSGTGFISGGE